MNLLDTLRQRPGGQALADRLTQEVRQRAADKLTHVRALFPTFTDHSIRHSDSVVSILDWLIPDKLKAAFNSWELYFLIAATYLHDIGMAENCPAPPEGTAWLAFLA